MKKSFFDKRIPTAFALFLLLGGIAATMLLVNQGVFTVIQATPEQQPKNVTVTNITDTSFTVSFTTLEKSIAAVSITVDGKELLLFDDRDTDTKNAYYAHEITVKNLKPNNNYGYKILSNGTSYPESDELFQAKTTEPIKELPSNVSMKGTVLFPDGSIGKDTLVIITPDEGAKSSVLTDSKGVYVIPARLLKNDSGTAYLNPEENIHMQIQVFQKDLVSSINATFIPNGTIPPISLSENYEFIAEISEELIATPSSLFSEPDATISNKLQITSPKKNETFIDSRPQFRGTAPAGNLLRISLDGTIASQLRSSPNGNWSYRSSAPLAIGNHKLSVTSGGKTVQQDFSILSSGSQIAESATPSATLIPTTIPSPTTVSAATPMITPTSAITPTPTGITVTSIPIGAPTEAVISNTPTPTSFVPTKIPLPPTGITEQSILLTGISLLFIVAGSVLFFIL